MACTDETLPTKAGIVGRPAASVAQRRREYSVQRTGNELVDRNLDNIKLALRENSTLLVSDENGTEVAVEALIPSQLDAISVQIDAIEEEIAAIGGGATAPTYITQTPSAALSNEQALSLLATGILKSTTATGVISIATAGVDYENPLTFSQGVTRTVNAITGDYITGKTGNHVWTGSLDNSGTLQIRSTSDATRGPMTLAASQFLLDYNNSILGTPSLTLDNANASGYMSIHLKAAGTVRGTWRADSTGALVYAANGGFHSFMTGGDIGSAGTQVARMSADGTFAIGPGIDPTPQNRLRAGGSIASFASAAGSTLDYILFETSTVTLTGGVNISTSIGFNYVHFNGPTITSVTPTTVGTSATVVIHGPPVAGGSVTITNPYSFWIRGGNVRMDQFGSTGLVKSTIGSVLSIATAGVDYVAPGTVAPIDALYLTLATNATLTNERVLVPTSGITAVDAGAGSTYTLTGDYITGKTGNHTWTGSLDNSGTLRIRSSSDATPGALTLTASQFLLDYNNSVAATPSLVLDNTNASGEMSIHLKAAGTMRGALRANSTGTVFHVVNGGFHSFMTGGDVGTGTQMARISADGTFAIGPGIDPTARNRLRASGNIASFASAAGSTLDYILFETSTVTLTGGVNIGTSIGFNYVHFNGPTITSAAATTVDTSATVVIHGAPAASGSVTITNPYSFWIRGGNVRMDQFGSTGLVKNTSGGVLSIASVGTDYTGIINLVAGAGLTGGGTTATDRTFDVVAADGTITVNADSIQVGTIQTANIANDAATFAKIQNITASRLLGRDSSGGDVQEITIGSGLALTSTTLENQVYTGKSGNQIWNGSTTSAGQLNIYANTTHNGILVLHSDTLFLEGENGITLRGAAVPRITIASGGGVTVASLSGGTTALVRASTAGLLSRTTVATADIDNDAVTFAKIQNITASRLLGRDSSGGDAQEITLGTGLSLSSTTLNVSGFEAPLTFSTGLTRATNTITNNVFTGETGSPQWNGSSNANNLQIRANTSNTGTLTLTATNTDVSQNLLVDGGLARFGGNGTHVWEVPNEAAGSEYVLTNRIPIKITGLGSTVYYIHVYDG